MTAQPITQDKLDTISDLILEVFNVGRQFNGNGITQDQRRNITSRLKSAFDMSEADAEAVVNSTL